MKKSALITIIAMSFLACNAQEQKDKKQESINTPQESWSVNKETDENGNITRYDSTYTWSYSNLNGDSNTVKLDSVMQSFNDFFQSNSPFDWNDHFSFFPKNDSLLMNNFFKHDYFFDQWNQHQLNIEKMMKEMDSIRNEFLNKNYPGLMDSKKKTSNEEIIIQ